MSVNCLNSAPEIKRLLEGTIKVLKQLVDLTEEKYAFVYENLPGSQREIESSIREVELLLNCLVYNTGDIELPIQDSVIVTALTQIRAEFGQVTECLLNVDLSEFLLKTFLTEVTEARYSWHQLTRRSNEVHKSMAALRDITYTIEDPAFQVISDSLNILALELGARFSKMNMLMRDLENWKQNFANQVVDFVDYTDSFRQKYQQKFESEFSKVKDILQVTYTVLHNHLENTKTLFNDVSQAMVLIQNQDILRQQMERLIQGVEVLLNQNGILLGEDKVKILDYLNFAIEVNKLADVLAAKIIAGLEASLIALEQVLKQINEQADELDSDAIHLGKLFGGDGNFIGSGFNVMKDVFNIILSQVLDLTYVKRYIGVKSQALLESQGGFQSIIENINKDYVSVYDGLQDLGALKGCNSNGEIDQIIDDVIEKVSSYLLFFAEMRDYYAKNIAALSEAIAVTRKKADNSAQNMEAAKNQLSLTYALFNGCVEAMGREMREIFIELKKPYVKLQVVGEIEEMTISIRESLAALISVCKMNWKDLSALYKLQQWELNPGYRDYLDKFNEYIKANCTDVLSDDVTLF